MDLRSTLRLAQLEDLEALVALDAIARRDPQRRRFIAQAIACGQCWVAADPHDAALLTGYGVLNDAFFEYPFIALVVVKESARRRGIAGAIMRTLESQCMGGKLFTSTNASNEPMRGLLSQLGFISSGQIENLDEGDPELVFVKFLS
ncbi:GNAT family N-acetyltransferase [Pseudomonas putida]|uniref:GNAT family N-acetyltransferase n=1 Tax=Pseudomonas putida TaxID=303 RepID=UPI0021F8E890|nr:GNAT family N-acetyltransferase [Pseudomonas putida]